MKPRTNSSISIARKQLIAAMEQIFFGRIESLPIRDGEPILNSGVRLIKQVKLGGNNSPKHQPDDTDFILKSTVVEFLERLDDLGTGLITVVQVRAGLPFLFEHVMPQGDKDTSDPGERRHGDGHEWAGDQQHADEHTKS